VQENIDSWTDRHNPTFTLLSESYITHTRNPTHAKYILSLLKNGTRANTYNIQTKAHIHEQTTPTLTNNTHINTKTYTPHTHRQHNPHVQKQHTNTAMNVPKPPAARFIPSKSRAVTSHCV
jgi:hypothetical protein